MTRVIDCTLPLYDYMPVGNVWAWDVPFQSQPITNDVIHGYELMMITMHSEAGTRLMIKAMQDKSAPKVDELPLDQLVNQDAIVIDIPCEIGYAVQPEDIEKAFNGVDFQEGDAVIIRTGWGDDNRWEKIGDDYARKTPYISKNAAEKLVEIMKANKSDLVGTDCAYWGRGDKYQLPEWASKPAWERNPFPSIEAKRYLAQYTKDKAYADFQSPYVMNSNGMMYIGAMCNLNQIEKKRFKMTVLPLKLKGARGSTCSVVVIED